MGTLRHSFGTRVLASNMVFAAITISSLSALFLGTYSRDLDRQLTGRAEALADFLAGQSQFAMLVGDRSELERIAANAVGEIVGKTTTEDLLDSIFSQFCIGK